MIPGTILMPWHAEAKVWQGFDMLLSFQFDTADDTNPALP